MMALRGEMFVLTSQKHLRTNSLPSSIGSLAVDPPMLNTAHSRSSVLASASDATSKKVSKKSSPDLRRLNKP